MGVDVSKRKLQAFIIAAIYADVAGSALAWMNGFVTPDVASFLGSVEFLAMVVIGGVASPWGASERSVAYPHSPVVRLFNDLQDVSVGLMIMRPDLPSQGIVPALGRLLRGSTMSEALEIDAVSMSFGGVVAVNQVSCHARKGRDTFDHWPKRSR